MRLSKPKDLAMVCEFVMEKVSDFLPTEPFAPKDISGPRTFAIKLKEDCAFASASWLPPCLVDVVEVSCPLVFKGSWAGRLKFKERASLG